LEKCLSLVDINGIDRVEINVDIEKFSKIRLRNTVEILSTSVHSVDTLLRQMPPPGGLGRVWCGKET
jgi:hypothetical protein